MVDVLPGQHLAHVGAARGVADHGGAAADEGDGLVARHLQPLHQRQGHEMARGQAVRRAVEADIEGGLAGVHHLPDLVRVGHLGQKAPFDQFLIDSHCLSSCRNKKVPCRNRGRREAVVPPQFKGRPAGRPFSLDAVSGAPVSPYSRSGKRLRNVLHQRLPHPFTSRMLSEDLAPPTLSFTAFV